MSDPICDMFNRIRNAQAVLKETVSTPFSNLKYEIAKILEKKGFIAKVEKKGRKIKRTIEITLKYKGEGEERRPAISGLKKISNPGQRIYKKAKELKSVKGGYGIAIISTPQGLIGDKEARKKRIGGEIICEIW